MKPKIDQTKFGSITIGGDKYDHDVLIRLNRKVDKRKKKLSKQEFGTSHILSKAEAEYVYEKGAKMIIIGSGQEGMLKLSDEAAAFFKKKGCDMRLLPTSDAKNAWNKAKSPCIGLFHITC